MKRRPQSSGWRGRALRVAVGLLAFVAVSALMSQCGSTSGLVIAGGVAPESDLPDQGPIGGDGGGGDTGGGATGGGGGSGGQDGGGDDGGGGTLPDFVGIDSYVYLMTTASGASTRQWPPAEYILLTSQPRTDLQGYGGVRVYLTNWRNGVAQVTSDTTGVWKYRTIWPGGTRIDITSPEGIPLLIGNEVVVLSTGRTTFPTADITLPTAELTDPVQVVIESLGASLMRPGGGAL